MFRQLLPKVSIALLTSGLLLGSSSWRQASAQELTGTLYGTVTAEDGALLPGVTVIVRSPQMIRGEQVLVTNEVGEYRIPALPPGVYSVLAELPGFASVNREGVRLAAGTSLAVSFRLKLSGVEETVTVVGESPLVDVRSSQAQTVIDTALIEELPTKRGFADVLTLAPGVVDTGYDFAPAQSVQGSSPRDNLFTVDGASANDTTVGYMFMDVPYDMLDQVQMTTGGISAEFGQASGGVFNFITKSGGNTFTGGASLFFQNESLQGNNLDDELRAMGLGTGSKTIENFERGFFAGGPMIRDRVWFFTNVRWIGLERTQPDFPAMNPRSDDLQAFIKLTSQVTRSTGIQGSYTYRALERNPSNASFQTLNAPETWTSNTAWRKLVFLGLNQTITSTTYAEARFSRSFGPAETRFPTNAVGYQDLVTGLLFGGRTGIYQNVIERDNRNIKGNLTHFREGFLGGSHDVRVGGEIEYAPLTAEYTHPTGAVQLLWNGDPYRVRLYNTPGFVTSAISRWALFAQDRWTLDRVTINAGVRIESTEGWLPEQGGGGVWFPERIVPATRDTVTWLTAVPRLGMVWDVFGDARTSLRGSYGRYANALMNQHMNYINPNGTGFREHDWIDLNGDRTFQDGEQSTLRRQSQASSNHADPNLRQPYMDSVHVGIDRQLGSNMAASVSGIWKRERDLIESIDVALPFSAYNAATATNPVDGQPITIFVLDPRFQGVGSVRRLTNPNDPVRLERRYRGVEFSLQKRMSDGWMFNGALNLGRSEGNIGNSFGSSVGSTNLYTNPNSLINIEGPLDMDSPVQIKLQAGYLMPYDVLFSATYAGLSGFPIITGEGFPSDRSGTYTARFTSADVSAIIVEPFVEIAGNPRGQHRFDFRHVLNLRAEKRFRAKQVNVGAILDVFNLFNINTTTHVQSLQFGHPNFLRPSRIELPRAAQLGLRVSF